MTTIVDASPASALTSLTYNNVGTGSTHNDTTSIASGQTLTVNGNVVVGVNSSTTTVIMSSTGNFTVGYTGSSQILGVGGSAGGVTSQIANLTLADGVNTVAVATCSIGESGSNNGGACTLKLGNGSNYIYADNVNLGTGKSSGTIQFAASGAGTLKIRDHNGTTGRATLLLGNPTSGSGASAGTMTLTGHSVDILASTATIGGANSASSTSATGNGTGTVSFDNGTFNVNTLLMGANTKGTHPTCSGTVNVGGRASYTAALNVNTSFILSDDTLATLLCRQWHFEHQTKWHGQHLLQHRQSSRALQHRHD